MSPSLHRDKGQTLTQRSYILSLSQGAHTCQLQPSAPVTGEGGTGMAQGLPAPLGGRRGSSCQLSSPAAAVVPSAPRCSSFSQASHKTCLQLQVLFYFSL